MRASVSRDPSSEPSALPAPGWSVWVSWLAWVLFAIALGMAATALGLLIANRATPTPPAWGFRGFPIAFGITFAMAGALVASRRPWNAVGWILCAEGLLASAQGLVYEYAVLALVERPGNFPGGEFFAWVDNWFWVVGMGIAGNLLLLLFPNGRLPSPRWRLVAWLALGGTALAAAGFALIPGTLSSFPSLQNPFGVEALSVIPNVFIVPMAVSVVLSAASLVIRYMHTATPLERQQLKWVAYGGALFAGAAVINQVEIAVRGSGIGNVSDILVILGVQAMPILIGVAVLRYRLYDIDVVINRTLVYVPLTGLLGGLYIGGIQLARLVFTELAGVTSDAVIIITVFVVASLFTPLRSSIQAFVDRTFKEVRDPIRELGKFAREIHWRYTVRRGPVEAHHPSAGRNRAPAKRCESW